MTTTTTTTTMPADAMTHVDSIFSELKLLRKCSRLSILEFSMFPFPSPPSSTSSSRRLLPATEDQLCDSNALSAEYDAGNDSSDSLKGSPMDPCILGAAATAAIETHCRRFRLYAAHTFPSLSVLNGAAVSAEERAEAKTFYAGRLTTEGLREAIKLAHHKSSRSNGRGAPEQQLSELLLAGLGISIVDEEVLRSSTGEGRSSDGGALGDELEAITSVDLSNNSIHILPRMDVWLKPTLLTTMDVSRNPLRITSPEQPAALAARAVIVGLNNLKVLRLRECGLSSLDFLSRHPSIEVLGLSGNSFPEIGEFCELPALTTLDLTGCGVATYKDAAFERCPSLKSLKLSNNKLKCAPFPGDVALDEFDVSSNRIQEAQELQGLQAVTRGIRHLRSVSQRHPLKQK
eukprot:GHVU01158542.1.p1 GENE.GHVU01158542.1~~GHVU01158542.1.p1  ORF type:complete len:422 (-),score=87.41 GHVU01158542.1:445-1653(-)